MGLENFGFGVAAYNRKWATTGQTLTHSGDTFGQDSILWMTSGRDVIIAVYPNCRSSDKSTKLALDAATAGMFVRRYSNNSTRIRNDVDEPIFRDHILTLPEDP